MKNKFLKLMALFVASAFANSAWAQTDGVYYLYDAQNKVFLSRGAAYGTEAVTDKYGIPFNWNSANESIEFLDWTSVYLFITGTSVYTDNASTGWAFTETEGGYYLQDKDKSVYTTHSIGDYGSYVHTTTDVNAATIWTLKTPAERDAILAAYSTENYSAMITAAGLDITADNFVATLNGDNYARKDMTSSIGTATFAGNIGSWTWNQVRSQGNQPAYGTNFAEAWQATGSYTQTITNLPEGIYKLTVNAFQRQGSNANCATLSNNGYELSTAYLKGNDQQVQIASWATDRASDTNPNNPTEAIALFNNGKYHNEIYVYVGEEGTLDITLAKPTFVGNCWLLFNNFTLTYYTNKVSEEDATAIITKAEGLTTGKMETSAATALASALATFKASATIANYNTLSSAVTTAENSITAYTGAAAYFTKMAGVLENTNVYTQEAYDAYYGDWLAAYEDGTLETATAANLNANTAYSTGWHSTNYIDDILLSTWTIGGEQANNYDKALYINTWSVEGNTDGSEFLAPFFEYWTGDANSLGANTIQAKITDLEPETLYSFTIRARVRQTNDKTKIAEGITMQVGEGTAVDISAGAQFGTGQFYIGNFTAVGETDAEGTLTATITVAENSNISWLSFYNAKYTEGEDLSAYIADYEFALANANTALGKGMDPNLRSALQSTVNTYSTVDNTDKAALITAKVALDEALTAVAASVAALDGSDLSAWTTTGNNGKFEANTWSNEGNTDGSNMKVPFAQNWIAKGTNLGDATMSYALTGQEPGYYKISGLVRSLNEAGGATPAGVFLFANDAIERAYNGTACTNGVYATPVVYGLVGEDGVLTIGIKIIGANVNWVAWKNLTIEYVGATLTTDIATNLTEEARTFQYNLTAQAAVESAVSALVTLSDANYTAAGKAIEAAYKERDVDFTALNEAIAAKEGKTLGFAAGEYAPYTNVAVMEALAAAKAINQETETVQANVIAATEALNAAAWVANTEEMNAIYDGSFEHDYSAIEGNVKPLGWNRTSGANTGYEVRYITNVPEGATSSNKGMFIKYTANYGKDAGYTMPLKANTVYALSFVYTGWGNTPTVNILVKDEEGNEVTITPASIKANADGQTDASNWQTYKGVFTTGDADANYILYFDKSESDQLQIAFGDFKLMKAETKEVTMNISDAKYATFIAPFDVELPAGVEAAKITGVEGNVLTEEAVEGTIPANTPVVLYSETAVSETFSGQSLATADTYTVGRLTGTYVDYQTTANSNTYVLQNNDGKVAFYLVGESAQPWIRANRCYMVYEAAAGAPMFSLERGEGTTSIEDAELTNETVVIYDLAGRRVEKMEKGIYIVNGKKVIR